MGYARSYGDTLDAMSVLIESLSMDGKPEKAMENLLKVLAYLGEPLSGNLSEEIVHKELIETHKSMQEISLASLDTMTDPQKIKAMHFLHLALWPSHQQRSLLCAVVSCRMVRLTLSHGLNLYSSTGIAVLGYAHTMVLRNYTEGYKLGKLAVTLNKSPKLVGEISLVVANGVCAFKEPIQALLPQILDNYRIAVKSGTVSCACANSMCYVIRAFLSGSPLASLQSEMTVFFHEMSKHNQTRPYLSLIPISNTITNLSGEPAHLFWDAVQGYEEDNDEKNLSESFDKNDIALCEIIITIQIAENFVFQRMDMAEKIVRQYQDFFALRGGLRVQFISVYRIFYSGLVAFHCFRETQDSYWMHRGRRAIVEMEKLAEECRWNFLNKMLLLTAEYHFSIGDFENATELYQQSLASAQAHRFLHEEAIANELAGYCQSKRQKTDLSIQFMERAIDCYKRWGAVKKVKSLRKDC